MRISIRKIFFVCVVLGGTAYGITILRGTHNLGGFEEKRRQIEQLEKENEKLQREIAEKQNYLAGYDEMDTTTSKKSIPEWSKKITDDLKGVTIGRPKEYFAEGLEIQRRLKLVSPNTKQFILQDGTPSDTPSTNQPRP